MLRVIALLATGRAQRRLAAALRIPGRAWNASLGFASRWAEAHAMAFASAPEVLVFDPYLSGEFDYDAIVHFSARFRSCSLLGYSPFPRGSARDVFELSPAGVRGIATQDFDDAPAALAALLSRILEPGTLVQALSLLERQTPASIRQLLPRVLFLADGNVSPVEVARLCHCHPKTIGSHLRSANLPSLGKLIVWTRLIRACHLLQDSERSVESIALVLGFASANSFRNQLVRYVGVCPSDVRKNGVHSALARFRAELHG